MIVSSLGSPLPSLVSSGVYTAGNPQYFSNLWNSADGTVPSDSIWNGWTGNSADVIVQRINLAPLFVQVLLFTYASSPAGAYAIDNSSISSVPVLGGAYGYFIQGSVLGLYTNSYPTNIDTQMILTRNNSFIFDHNVWRGSISGSVLGPGVMNIGDVVMQFLNAPNNVNAANPAGNAQQALVVANMLNYMSNYNVWAFQYGFTNATMKAYLRSIQPGLVSSIQGLYQNSYFPTNPNPCVQ
jgi:hypothetical protein